MHLVKIDCICLQATQRIVDLLHNAAAAGVAERLAVFPVESDLGSDGDFLAPAALFERLADDLLGMAEAVNRRGVDQRDAAVYRRLDGVDRQGVVAAAPHPAADCPGAKRNARRLQVCAGDLRRFDFRLCHIVLPFLLARQHGTNSLRDCRKKGAWVPRSAGQAFESDDSTNELENAGAFIPASPYALRSAAAARRPRRRRSTRNRRYRARSAVRRAGWSRR